MPEPLSTASTAYRAALDVIRAVEPRVADAIGQEVADQREMLKLIASENYASPATLLAMGNWFSDKYAEGTIGRRFYAGCRNVDTVESLAAEHAKELFGARHAYVQPHSGIDANLVAFWAVLGARVEVPFLEKTGVRQINDLTDADWAELRQAFGNQRMLGMSLDAGGHLTHGFRPNISGKMFDQRSYGTDPATGLIDYEALRTSAREFKPLIIVAGYSAYPRLVNFRIMREIADEVGATLMVDMAHFAGLVAGKVLTGDFDPVPHAQIVTTTTHKSLRGPRGGMVLCDDSLKDQVDRGCPMVLGGPLPHVMAAKAVALAEARQRVLPRLRPAHRRQLPRPRRGPDAPRRDAGDRRHGQPPQPDRRRLLLRPHRPPGRGRPARLRHRHQPQRHPRRPERRLVHLRHPHRHPGPDHPRPGHGGDGRGRRPHRPRPHHHGSRARPSRAPPPRPSTSSTRRSPTRSPTAPPTSWPVSRCTRRSTWADAPHQWARRPHRSRSISS